MSSKLLVTYLEKTGANVAACVERLLNATTRSPVKVLAVSNNESETVGNILDATLAVQLATAMELVRGVGASAVTSKKTREATNLRSPNLNVIDLDTGEYNEISK